MRALLLTLREALGDPEAQSFQLLGEDLVALSGAELAAAAAAYSTELARVPAALRARFETEQRHLQREAHAWLRLHNRSLHGRIAGYVALGRRCGWAYPWPVVAILGICQVIGGLGRNRLLGLVGETASRLGLRRLEAIIDGSDDVLRRTNRGIFADSVPTVLYGLRVHELRRTGDAALGDALLSGPAPPLMDDESRAIAAALADGLAIADPAARFRVLADLTLVHFAREQRIFTYHLLGGRRRPPTPPRSPLARRLVSPRAVFAPRVTRSVWGARLTFARFPLPHGFDLRDHDARVQAFGRAFVRSVTGSPEDYEVARAYVERRFRRSGRPEAVGQG